MGDATKLLENRVFVGKRLMLASKLSRNSQKSCNLQLPQAKLGKNPHKNKAQIVFSVAKLLTALGVTDTRLSP